MSEVKEVREMTREELMEQARKVIYTGKDRATGGFAVFGFFPLKGERFEDHEKAKAAAKKAVEDVGAGKCILRRGWYHLVDISKVTAPDPVESVRQDPDGKPEKEPAPVANADRSAPPAKGAAGKKSTGAEGLVAAVAEMIAPAVQEAFEMEAEDAIAVAQEEAAAMVQDAHGSLEHGQKAIQAAALERIGARMVGDEEEAEEPPAKKRTKGKKK
jgi:hypothetical protein